ncbi:MAG: glycosyltransferase family 4 protein [Lentisphaerae bacterium]|nr:glycosyltransferase family 4 protein [Lentisphaerota bacterium]
MPAAIHQFVAGFTNGDAISNEARVLRTIFRSWGLESDIFSETRRILPELRRTARDAQSYVATARPDDIVLLHLSIGSVVNEIFATLPTRKAILYHNITPAHYFTLINRQTATELERGRRQLQHLAGAATINLADSRFNADELRAAGYRDPQVLPLVLTLEDLTGDIDARVRRTYADGRVNILFVGRCAPNKRLEDLLDAFCSFQRAVDPHARLIHVGSFAGNEPYYYYLRTRARELRLHDVHFAGSVPQAQLNAYYASAAVFLCMSEHEGFCIPILEAMTHGVPVLAHAAGAVPETMDGAGVLFREKDYELVAEMLGRLATDKPLRAAVIAGQQQRLERYRARDLQAELRRHLAPLLDR